MAKVEVRKHFKRTMFGGVGKEVFAVFYNGEEVATFSNRTEALERAARLRKNITRDTVSYAKSKNVWRGGFWG